MLDIIFNETADAVLGQIFGILSMILTFTSYQCKKPRSLLLVQIASTIAMMVSYLFLHATSGMVLNAVCVVRNLIYFNKNKKYFSFFLWPYILAAVMVGLGAMSWTGYESLLMIVALGLNTIVLSWNNNQILRWSILLTSSMILVYNVIVFSVGGMLNESVAIVSSGIGIIRFRHSVKAVKADEETDNGDHSSEA